MKSRLRQELDAYLKKSFYPMHMPGHKRRLMPEEDLPYAWDMTEVNGTDDLHHANGILKEAMDRTARLCHADRTWYLVNGSTVGNLAGVYALTHQNGEVLMDRSCHRSLFHIAQLRNLHVHWLMPAWNQEYGISGGISPESVKEKLEQHPGCEAVIITSPTYEGVVSNVKAIADICHQRQIPLFVDEAHGAHFGLAPGFPASAMQGGADVCVQSFHKTLPSLTQTAVLHMHKGLVDEHKIEQALDIFETSSPSYPLMVSLDACTEYLIDHGQECFARWHADIEAFEKGIAGLRHLKVFCHQGDAPSSYGIFACDPGKILIHSDGMTGLQMQNILRDEYRFETEMSLGGNVLALTGPGDDPAEILRFARKLKELDQRAPAGNFSPGFRTEGAALDPVLTIAEAMETDCEKERLDAAEGKISHEYVWCYPPGIPLVIPGERITAAMIRQIQAHRKEGNPVHFSESDDDQPFIQVCR